jgi:transcriptional regulator
LYIPKEYREEDTDKLVAFMQSHSFATLVSFDGEKPIATHLPFVIKQDGEDISLITHMARGNKQWRSFGDGDVLVIFAGPNAYVSPTNYEDRARVPTWNYIAVHAYGRPRITEFAEHDEVLRSMIDKFEPSYLKQYEDLPAHYKLPNMKGIVCVEIAVTKLEGQFKLSQDKSHEDQQRVARSLDGKDGSARELAAEMKRGL